MLLGALFTAGDSAPLVESGMGLPALLERAVWPQLGVSQQTHACLMAWVHFVEYVRHPGARPGLDRALRVGYNRSMSRLCRQ